MALLSIWVRNTAQNSLRKEEIKEMLNGLPGDPVMLLSVVNTKLRDFYPSLDTMCEEMELNQKELTDKLEMIDYEYDAQKNQFV